MQKGCGEHYSLSLVLPYEVITPTAVLLKEKQQCVRVRLLGWGWGGATENGTRVSVLLTD